MAIIGNIPYFQTNPNRGHDSWWIIGCWSLVSKFWGNPKLHVHYRMGRRSAFLTPKACRCLASISIVRWQVARFNPIITEFFQQPKYGQLDLAKSRKGFCHHSCDFKVSDPHFQGPLRPSNTERDHAFWLRENSLTSSQPSQPSSSSSSSSSKNQLHCVQWTWTHDTFLYVSTTCSMGPHMMG